jgi:riboflavin synthase
MFTGLIETTGTVLALKPMEGGATRIVVAAPALAGRWKIGDSIAVNGVCLTATDVEDADEPHPGRFAADLADETIRRTTLTRLHPGSLVNLELPTPSGSPMGGHVVQGHVDGTGRILSIEPLHHDLDRTDWRLRLEAPRALAGSIVQQGSLTVDGISLTVAKLDAPDAQGNVSLEIAIIPHTYQSTNLRSLLSGSEINLETDVLARYAARRMEFDEILPSAPASELPVAESEPPAPALTWHSLAPTLSHTAPSGSPTGITVEHLIANGY